MKKSIPTKIRLPLVLLLGGYFCAYPLLWSRQEGVLFALTDHGCIRKTCEAPALRSEWLARGPLCAPITAFYKPVNALLYSDSKWK
jgi:hypothetical protein